MVGSVTMAVMLVANRVLPWPCTDWDAVLLSMALCGLQPLLILISVVYLADQLRAQRRIWASLPLLLNVVVFLIIQWPMLLLASMPVPTSESEPLPPLPPDPLRILSNATIDWRLQWNWNGYNQIVRLVEADEIVPKDTDNCRGCYLAPLPSDLTHLSCRGEIMIDKRGNVTRVFFFTHRGMFMEFMGYMYRSDDQLPQIDDLGRLSGFVHERNPGHCERKQPNWFFCSHFH
jgi:hypothetical protein